ncbi:MAG: SDR family oxidoreductase [Candidatus Methylarchaceae archaeon HK02M2]|nr:SDR family oxidoreductase [Candidatus Methylarchaceae archaeon HK02M2]
MANRVCMVTGATSGLGKVTAKALAAKGATVIVLGRNSEKAVTTVRKIIDQTGNSNVEFILADLSIQSDIYNLAEQFMSQYQKLDVLVNNAGAFYYKRQETVDGIEMTFAVNYLSHFLLTNLLIDTLKASAPSRIINVSSGIHKRANINFEDLQSRQKYSGAGAYGQAKLAQILFTYELARRLEATSVTVNAVNPGLVATKFGLDGSRVMGSMKRLINVFSQSPKKGAETIIFLATSPEVENVSGRYFEKKRAVKSSKASYNETTALRLWQISLDLIRAST